MFAPMKSRSSLKLGHLGSKTRSPGQIKGKYCKHSRGPIFKAIIMSLVQNVCLDDWGQKLGHQTKSKENFVNTLAVTFVK